MLQLLQQQMLFLLLLPLHYQLLGTQTSFAVIEQRRLQLLILRLSYCIVYKDLQNSTDPEIKGKAHYYLNKAAEGDYIYARKQKFALKVQWLGPIGMVLRWLHAAYLAPKYYTIAKKNGHDPRMAGTREIAEEMYDRLSNRVNTLMFWKR